MVRCDPALDIDRIVDLCLEVRLAAREACSAMRRAYGYPLIHNSGSLYVSTWADFFSVLLMDAGAGLAKRDALGAARSEERPVPGEPDGPKRPEDGHERDQTR